MSLRYYIADVHAHGSDAVFGNHTACSHYPGNHVNVIRTNPNGTPMFGWAFVAFDTNNHAPLLLDPGIVAFPEASLDVTWNSIPLATRTEFTTKVSLKGVSTGGISGATPFRLVVRGIGQQQEPAFHEAVNLPFPFTG